MPYWSRWIVFASSLCSYCIRFGFVLFPFVPREMMFCKKYAENESADAGMALGRNIKHVLINC